MECDLEKRIDAAVSYISIHALTWSATEVIAGKHGNGHISIHALTWSATYRIGKGGRTAYFNPRTHMECDL